MNQKTVYQQMISLFQSGKTEEAKAVAKQRGHQARDGCGVSFEPGDDA